MPTVSLKAHYDGERIMLDEPFDLLPDSSLVITVLRADTDEFSDRSEWTAFSTAQLARGYSDSEPDYSEADVKHL